MIYRFGNFELDDSARELRAGGERVDVEPKAFELLLYLVLNRDRAITKDELLNELWPQTIVTETALTRCVMKARRAVGDDSGTQSIIRTVHSHGYRFVADLLAAQEHPENTSSSPPLRRRPARQALLVGAAALLVVLGMVTVTQLGPSRNAEVRALAVLPVSNLTDDDELTWVRAGLMSLIKRMLEDGGVNVVSDGAVLGALGDASLATPPGEQLFTLIRERSGADSVLHTTLDSQGGLKRLSAVLTHADGRRTRRVIVGESPAALAAEMATVVSGLVAGGEARRDARFSKVSTDPFVNEMYARALDLELQGKLEEARQLFRVAADLEPELFWLRYEIALCTRDLREWDEAERMFADLYDEARYGDDARALVVTLNSQGVMYFKRNDYDTAESMFLQAMEAASERAFARDRASVQTNLALINGRRGDTMQAREHYAAALSAYDEAGLEPAPTFYNNYAGLLLSLGDFEEARSYAQRAIDGFRLRGQRRFEAPSLNRMAKILRRLGDADGAATRHQQALAIYRELDDTVGELSVMIALTAIDRESGDLTRAKNNALEVVRRAAATDNRLLQADAQLSLASVEADLGRHTAAVSHFDAALAIYRELGDDSGLRSASMGATLSLLELGDRARASTIADSMLQTSLAANNEAAETRARWLLGKVAEDSGATSEARSYFEAALAHARDREDRSALAVVASSLASLDLDEGKAQDAAVLIEEIRPLASGKHDFQRLDARLAIAHGDKARARAILSELRNRAGEAWSTDDDALLASLDN